MVKQLVMVVVQQLSLLKQLSVAKLALSPMYNPHARLPVAYFATYLPTYRRPTIYKMDYKGETSYNTS
jgi:hypothetical protein